MVFRLIVAGSILLCSSASASVISSTFGPGYTFDQGVGLTVSDSYDHSVAIAFTPAFSYLLSGVTVATARQSVDAPDEVLVGIYANNGGLPGTLLESFDLGTPTATLTDLPSGSILSALSSTHPYLAAGSLYWIVMDSPVAPDSFGDLIWATNGSIVPATGLLLAKDSTGAWLPASQTAGTNTGVFELTGNIVPEPGTLLMLGIGLAGMAGIRKLRA